ncbi:MAG: ABC transporter substrate-binding protein [bacterium]|nr:ABC transporter substrate-binding protein [bacterium]
MTPSGGRRAGVRGPGGRRRGNRWLCAGVLALVLAGCRAESPAPIRIAVHPWPPFDLLYLAQEQGLFAEAGVPVHLVELSSLADARRAYERGQTDGLACTVVELLGARSVAGRDPQAILVVDTSDGADVVLARPGLGDVAALRGRRVAAEPASSGVYLLARALVAHGLTLADVAPVFIDQTHIAEAFAAGEVDAAVTYPPFAAGLERLGAVPVFSSRALPGEIVDVVALDAALVAERPHHARAIARAFEAARRFAEAHPDEAHATMAAREGIEPREFRAVLGRGIRLVPAHEQARYLAPGGLLELTLPRVDAVMRRIGHLGGPSRVPGAVARLDPGSGPP